MKKFDTLYEEIDAKLNDPKTLEEIAMKHTPKFPEIKDMLTHLKNKLELGVKTEREHTSDETTAETIALHHLDEDPNYYPIKSEQKNNHG